MILRCKQHRKVVILDRILWMFISAEICPSKTQPDSCLISTGMPQGLILGPLLFIIFINDIPKISMFFSTTLYADDTSLTASGSDLDSLLCEINNHLPAVYDWLCSYKYKLTLNLTKTKYIIYASSKGKLQSISTINCR